MPDIVTAIWGGIASIGMAIAIIIIHIEDKREQAKEEEDQC